MSDTTTSSTPHVQPLTNRRKMMRGIIGLVIIVVGLIILWIVQNVRDVDLPTQVNTVGWIAAIEDKPNGSEAVLFKPDGTMMESNGYQDGDHERDPVWRPDGNRVFFTSDRTDASTQARQVNLYRWNPGSGKVERRSATQGSYTDLIYSTSDSQDPGLVAMGGIIVNFDPVTGDTAPVLPPSSKDESGNTENGRTSSIESSPFATYGTSFKEAAWFDDKKYIVAIMRGDEGDTMVLQDMTPVDGKLNLPIPIVAGDHIDMDVNRKTGCIVFTLQFAKWPSSDPAQVPPEFIKNGKVVLPFHHMIGILDPKNLTPMQTSQGPGPTTVQPIPVIQLPSDANAFGSPVFSPDGSSIVVSVGTYSDSELHMTGLLVMPAVAGGGQSPSALHKGAVDSVSYSGDGKSIAYCVHNGSTSQIHVMTNEGSDDHVIAQGKGSFSEATFSPQVGQ